MDYFLLHAECVPVRGASRSVICDLGKGQLRYVPHLLHEVLECARLLPLDKLKAHFEHAYDEGIDTWFAWLEKEQLGFWTHSPEAWPPIELDSEYQGGILHAVLEWRADSPWRLASAIRELVENQCAHLSLWLPESTRLTDISIMLDEVLSSRLQRIEIFVPYRIDWSSGDIAAFLQRHVRVQHFAFFDAPFADMLFAENGVLRGRAYFFTENYPDLRAPRRPVFWVDKKAFARAQTKNLALYKTVSIAPDGTVRNHPTHRAVFGQFPKDNLSEIVARADFQAVWSRHNDLIEKCRSCEHRWICCDTSDFDLEVTGWKKTQDCGYDPFAIKSFEES